jgi:hypothetical protein
VELREFIRLAVHTPIDETDFSPRSSVEFARAAQDTLRVLREFDFAGSVGTYKAVAEISKGVETYTPTRTSTPAHGTPDMPSIVPSARLVTYLPKTVSDEDLSRLIHEIVISHPWEHPVVEVDRVFLWMPD